MQKCDMWKTEINNLHFLKEYLQWKGSREKYRQQEGGKLDEIPQGNINACKMQEMPDSG